MITKIIIIIIINDYIKLAPPRLPHFLPHTTPLTLRVLVSLDTGGEESNLVRCW